MNSWDLFDTLVGGRDISTPCGDQPEGNHFPILENLLKVMHDDVIVSDYYDSQKAHRILINIVKLNNQLHVGNAIKSTGKIWNQITVEHHTGDQPYEITAAWRAGIRATLVQLSLFTQAEQELYDAGFKGLALSIREARLISYDPKYRQLQLLQNQANFPFLFLASILLHRKLTVAKLNRVLMCSRDAFLWHQLQEKVRNLHKDAGYEIHYFYTSRLTRYFPSEQVLKYTRQMLSDKALIVDVCGSGQSLRRLTNHLTLKPSLWLIVGYVEPKRRSFSRVPYAIEWLGTTAVELVNLADHPMVCDIAQKPDETFVPVFLNSTGVDWARIPQINAMHEAFNLAISVMQNYDFSTDLRIDDVIVIKMLKKCFQRIEDGESLLTAFANSFFGAEERNTRQALRNKAASAGCTATS
jgi:hypothetical protein